MWMSKQWNGVPDAFRFFITLLLVLVYLTMNNDGIDDAYRALTRRLHRAGRPTGHRDEVAGVTASGYKSCMDTNRWIHDPVGAFRTWRGNRRDRRDRRPFARSVVQHVAMFERFLRYLTERRVSLAFGPDHVVAFLAELDRTCAPGTSTRVR